MCFYSGRTSCVLRNPKHSFLGLGQRHVLTQDITCELPTNNTFTHFTGEAEKPRPAEYRYMFSFSLCYRCCRSQTSNSKTRPLPQKPQWLEDSERFTLHWSLARRESIHPLLPRGGEKGVNFVPTFVHVRSLYQNTASSRCSGVKEKKNIRSAASLLAANRISLSRAHEWSSGVHAQISTRAQTHTIERYTFIYFFF